MLKIILCFGEFLKVQKLGNSKFPLEDWIQYLVFIIIDSFAPFCIVPFFFFLN
jgi:hypothetical protein